MSVVLALGALLLCMSACQHIPKTQLILFESLSFNMPLKSLEKVFGEADEVIEETETAYRDTWHARDPYFYKTGRLFYHYENIALNGYTGRADFTFSKSHRLEEATILIPAASKMEQQVALYNLSQTIKKEIESLPDYQSMTVEMVGLDQDSYQYKVKLQGQTEELWVEVYSTELGYHEKPEDKEYGVGIIQYRRHTP